MLKRKQEPFRANKTIVPNIFEPAVNTPEDPPEQLDDLDREFFLKLASAESDQIGQGLITGTKVVQCPNSTGEIETYL